MTTETAASPELIAEKKIRAVLARTLWQADNADQSFADNTARKAAYKEQRRAYFGKARKLAKQLNKKGISLSMADKT